MNEKDEAERAEQRNHVAIVVHQGSVSGKAVPLPWYMRACVCVFMREFLRENTRELCEREKRVVRGNSR